MILIASGVRIWLSTGHTDTQGHEGLGHNLSPATYFHPRAQVANTRYSTYSELFARIAYRWHPLFGRIALRRGKDLKCIYTDWRSDLCC